MKYLKLISQDYPFKWENPPQCKVELWDFSKSYKNKEALKEAVTSVASLSVGKNEPKCRDVLFNKLISLGHESPFEFIRFPSPVDGSNNGNLRKFNYEFFYNMDWYMSNFSTVKLKVPIFVARQIMRHRSFSYMELSRRWTRDNKIPFEFWYPKDLSEEGRENLRKFYVFSIDRYYYLLNSGFSPAKARCVIPVAAYTEFWMQGDYNAWLNFFIYRLHPESQYETRLVAESIFNLMKKHQPEIINTMKKEANNWLHQSSELFIVARVKRLTWFKKNYLEKE